MTKPQKPRPRMFEGATAVLISGGLHSAYAALRAMREIPGPLMGVFFNHGQRDGEAQEVAVLYVAQRLGIEMISLVVEPLTETKEGAYESRNEVLIREVVSNGAERVVMGLKHWLPIYSGSDDSNFWWAGGMAALYRKPVLTPSAFRPDILQSLTLTRFGIYPARLFRG